MSKPRTLEEKQLEQSRLAKHYKANKRAAWAAFCISEPRILTFQKNVKAMRNPADILSYVRDSWVMQASPDARLYALRIINKHANRMALQAGGETLSDPMPPKKNLFIAARELLAVR